MKPNVIVALLVGLVIGVAAGKVISGPSSSGSSASAAAAGDETTLAVKSSDMPAGTFDGMTDAQKYAVMKVMNDNTCDCGCGRGSLATCVKTDPNCPKSPAQLRKMVQLAKEGKDAQQIQLAMFGSQKGGVVAARKPASQSDDQTVYKVPLDGSPILGNVNAPVTIVEFSDYQCPFCGRAHRGLQPILKQYGDKVRLVMRQNPLESIHPFAKGAARAAVAAGMQGKFWPMHDIMFEHQPKLDEASLEGYAKEIGLNVEKWKADMKDPKVDATIAHDQQVTQSLGAGGTPAFFINGRKYSGSMDANPADFTKIIDQELARAENLAKTGVKPSELYAKLVEKGVTAPPAAPAAAAPAQQVKRIEVPADSPFKGPKAAKVVIVEWSDFQCPFCSRATPVVKQITEAYPKDVKFVFRNLPLPMHQNAEIAAEAAMAANEQGKFWQMHDVLFQNQRALDRASLEKYAQDLGLDMTKFRQALDTGKFKARIQQDAQAGNSVGATGTPTFFINGRMHLGAPSFEQAKQMIDEEIGKANQLMAKGVKLDQVYDKLLDQAIAAGPQAPPPATIDVSKAPIAGDKTAPVTMVVFSDFQCPFCSRAVPAEKAVQEKYKGKVKFAFKNLPLPMHPNARIAAQAGMAAAEQGKFWEMHDLMFANQRALDRASLEKYAQQIGLDMNKFRQALDTNKFEAQIAADSAEATRVGVQGTPTFYVNGRQVTGAASIEEFSRYIDEELSKSAQATKGHVAKAGGMVKPASAPKK